MLITNRYIIHVTLELSLKQIRKQYYIVIINLLTMLNAQRASILLLLSTRKMHLSLVSSIKRQLLNK